MKIFTNVHERAYSKVLKVVTWPPRKQELIVIGAGVVLVTVVGTGVVLKVVVLTVVGTGVVLKVVVLTVVGTGVVFKVVVVKVVGALVVVVEAKVVVVTIFVVVVVTGPPINYRLSFYVFSDTKYLHSSTQFLLKM